MAAIPESTKHSLEQRLSAHARQHWPGITGITVRFHGHHAYLGALLDDPDAEIKLVRLRYGGYAGMWGVAIRRASHEDYQPTRMPDGTTAASPEDALDLAVSLYLPEAAA
jgi:hypothetical protein